MSQLSFLSSWFTVHIKNIVSPYPHLYLYCTYTSKQISYLKTLIYFKILTLGKNPLDLKYLNS